MAATFNLSLPVVDNFMGTALIVTKVSNDALSLSELQRCLRAGAEPLRLLEAGRGHHGRNRHPGLLSACCGTVGPVGLAGLAKGVEVGGGSLESGATARDVGAVAHW